MQHDQNIVTEYNFEKIVQEECAKMHQQITGCPLTRCYTLIAFMLYTHLFEVPQRIAKIKTIVNFWKKKVFSPLRLKDLKN